MKAFLLSAGLGTRLAPLTDTIPKCLLPINGQPLLQYWLDHVKGTGIEKVLINTHKHYDQIESYCKTWTSLPEIILTREQELLGTAGTLYTNKSFVDGEEDFFLLYADNITTNVSLSSIYEYHKKKNDSIFTTFAYPTNIPEQKGIFTIDSNNKVKHFIEKPKNMNGLFGLANSGIGVLNCEIFDYINNLTFDMGYDIMPRLINKMYIKLLETNQKIIDIGTLEDYKLVLKEWGKYDSSSNTITGEFSGRGV